jgi:phosphinothricin acetyltransferase
MTSIAIRQATAADLPGIVEIQNYYILNTHITFDVKPYTPELRLDWFHEHSDGRRCRTLVAADAQGAVLGYAATGRFRPKEAYDTTVEVSIACSHAAAGQGIGSQLYRTLFDAIAEEDINRIVAGIAQPNQASNALHARFGFKPVGTFSAVGRKFGKYWDVLWMERPLVVSSGT